MSNRGDREIKRAKALGVLREWFPSDRTTVLTGIVVKATGTGFLVVPLINTTDNQGVINVTPYLIDGIKYRGNRARSAVWVKGTGHHPVEAIAADIIAALWGDIPPVRVVIRYDRITL